MGKKPEKLADKSGIITGIILILIGIFLMLDSLGVMKFSADYIISLIGVIFLLSYFATKNPGLLISGAMLSLFSLILLFNLYSLPYLWILSISLSFFAVYITREKNTSWALIPGSILLAIAIIAVFEFYTDINAFPIILIMLGAYLLYKNYKKGKR